MKIDYTKKSVKEVIKNPSFWRRVKRDFIKSSAFFFICNLSSDFRFFWEKAEFHQLMLKKAAKFAKSNPKIEFNSDRSTLGLDYDDESYAYFCMPLRKARLEFLDWMIKNTAKK